MIWSYFTPAMSIEVTPRTAFYRNRTSGMYFLEFICFLIIRGTIIWKATVNRNHLGSPKTPQTLQEYSTKGVKDGSQWNHYYAERCKSLCTANEEKYQPDYFRELLKGFL